MKTVDLPRKTATCCMPQTTNSRFFRLGKICRVPIFVVAMLECKHVSFVKTSFFHVLTKPTARKLRNKDLRRPSMWKMVAETVIGVADSNVTSNFSSLLTKSCSFLLKNGDLTKKLQFFC